MLDIWAKTSTTAIRRLKRGPAQSAQSTDTSSTSNISFAFGGILEKKEFRRKQTFSIDKKTSLWS